MDTIIETQIAIPQIPYSPANEEALLCAALLDPEEVLPHAKVIPEDFYIVKNRWIWEAMLDLRRRGQAVDFVTVCATLHEAGRLAEIGGRAEVTRIASAQASSYNFKSYAATLKDRSLRREVIRLSQNLAINAYDLDGDLRASIGYVMERLSKTATGKDGARHISEIMNELLVEAEEASKNPREIYGISTGFPDWDRVAGGLQRGEVVKIVGKPGTGKSLLAVQTVINAVTIPGNCKAAAIYSMEMGALQVARRAASGVSKVKTKAIRSGRMNEDEWGAFAKACEMLYGLPIYIDDQPQTTYDVEADILRLIEETDLELVLLDYEALFEDDGDGWERLNRISKRVKDLAKKHNVNVISIGDMTKAGIQGGKSGTTGQAAAAGPAQSIHNVDEMITLSRDTANPQLINMVWDKLREGDGVRFVRLIQAEGLPLFQSYQPPNAQRPGAK